MRLKRALWVAGPVALMLALGLGYGVQTNAPPPAAPRASHSRVPAPRGVAESSRPSASPLSRDLLRYAEEAGTAQEPERREPLGPIVTLPAPPPPPAERLIGFVWRAGRMRAAVALPGGETAVLAAGETARGYTLVTLDEERGGVLRLPDGGELTLVAPH